MAIPGCRLLPRWSCCTRTTPAVGMASLGGYVRRRNVTHKRVHTGAFRASTRDLCACLFWCWGVCFRDMIVLGAVEERVGVQTYDRVGTPVC